MACATFQPYLWHLLTAATCVGLSPKHLYPLCVCYTSLQLLGVLVPQYSFWLRPLWHALWCLCLPQQA